MGVKIWHGSGPPQRFDTACARSGGSCYGGLTAIDARRSLPPDLKRVLRLAMDQSGASSWKRLDPWGFHPRIDIARESVSFGIEHMDVLGVNLETDGLAATYSVKSA